MHPVLKAILGIAEEVVSALNPPAGKVIDIVKDVVKDKSKLPDQVDDIGFSAIQVIESFKGADIADEVKFRAGVATIEAGVKLVRESLKPSTPVTEA